MAERNTPSAHGSMKTIPPVIKRMVGELGLRFRPASAAAMEDHRRAVELLARDVADIPGELLQSAIDDWVRDNSFMPRAADLVKLAQKVLTESHQSTSTPLERYRAHADRGNADLMIQGRRDILWVATETGCRLVSRAEIEAEAAWRRDPCRPRDVERIMQETFGDRQAA